jgi:hypothetical protein
LKSVTSTSWISVMSCSMTSIILTILRRASHDSDMTYRDSRTPSWTPSDLVAPRLLTPVWIGTSLLPRSKSLLTRFTRGERLNTLSRDIHLIPMRLFGLHEIYSSSCDKFWMVGRRNIRELPQHDADWIAQSHSRKKFDKKISLKFSKFAILVRRIVFWIFQEQTWSVVYRHFPIPRYVRHNCHNHAFSIFNRR